MKKAPISVEVPEVPNLCHNEENSGQWIEGQDMEKARSKELKREEKKELKKEKYPPLPLPQRQRPKNLDK